MLRRFGFLFLGLVVTGLAYAEDVHLKSGLVKSGEIVEKTDQDITLQKGDDTFTIPFRLIAEDQAVRLKALPNKTLPAVQVPADNAPARPPADTAAGAVSAVPEVSLLGNLPAADRKAGEGVLPTDIYEVTQASSNLPVLHSPRPAMTPSQFRELRTLFQNREYAKVNATLDEYQKLSEADPAQEEFIWDAYSAFYLADQETGGALKDWASACPDAYQPYMALGQYYYEMGWKSRGDKYIYKTTQKQLDDMRSFFDEAEKNLLKALSIRPGLMKAYVCLIELYHTAGNLPAEAEAVKKAMELCPYSFRLWGIVSWTKEPKWGGSLEEMEALAKSAEQYARSNPALTMLYGEIYEYQAREFEKEEKYREALALLDRALLFGEQEKLYTAKARIYFEHFQDGDKAWENANKSLALDALSLKARMMRIRIFCDVGQYDRMFADLQVAEELRPHQSAEWRSTLSAVLLEQGHKIYAKDLKQAIRRYDLAIQLNNQNFEAHYWRGRAHQSLGNDAAAIADLKQALALRPRDYESYQWLAYLLSKENKWDQVISYWNIFLKLEPEHAGALLERAKAYYHKRDRPNCVTDLLKACQLGNQEACSKNAAIGGAI